MKIIFISIIINLLFCISVLKGEIDDSDVSIYETKNTNYELFLFGGIGVIQKSGDFGLSFGTIPIFNIGLEYPITDSRNWSIQLKSHYWQAESKINATETVYYKISGNIYAQLALSAYLKWYYLNLEKFRSSIHLGYYSSILNQGTYTGFDLGLNIDYKINSDYSISIMYNTISYNNGSDSGSFDLFPRLYSTLSLNFYYNLNIGL